MLSLDRMNGDQDAMLCIAFFGNFSNGQRLRYVSQTGAEPLRAGESSSVQEGSGQQRGNGKEEHLL